MSEVILKIENLSKQYRLGNVGSGTIGDDLKRFWCKIRGKEDPFLKIGESNDRTSKGNSEYVWALKDINFEVKRGEVLGIIGKNGAGKSTLLKILSKVTGPTTGAIKSNGRIASLLEVGTGFHPEMTGRENIYLNGAILGMTKKEIASKINEIITFSGCERYIDTPTKRYSSGMTVRLAFAVAAHLEPDILIVDEVLAVGDVEFQKKAIGKMKSISEEGGRTVLFVSHNMAAVKNLCTSGIILENGMITFEGTSDDAINYYLENAYTNSLLDFNDRSDRKGNHKLRIEEIIIENNKGTKVSELTSGEAYNILFKYIRNEYVDPKQFTVVIEFKNNKDEVVTTIATDEQGTIISDVKKSGYIKIELPKLQFREGKYSISYMFSEKRSFNTPHKILDHIPDAYFMTVVRGDYWNSGILNRPNGFIHESTIELI